MTQEIAAVDKEDDWFYWNFVTVPPRKILFRNDVSQALLKIRETSVKQETSWSE